jgi:mannan endo-1,4-beta-mannosidase
MKPITPLLLAALMASCAVDPNATVKTVDPNATPETKALFRNLDEIRKTHVLFGHQDDLAYGVTWVAEAGRSDVKEVAGAYPAVFGWEIGHIELDSAQNLDKVNFQNMKRWMREAYEMGGVNTISWHLNNPVNGASSWDKTVTVPHILPGGSHHEVFLTYMDRLAAFLGDIQTADGTPIPVIFRPWHEQTGGWFWWGSESTTPEDYIALYRFTVEYLRDTKGLRNILYAWSPNSPSDYGYENFLVTYPGDEYVDVMGFDDYWSLDQRENGVAVMTAHLKFLVETAEARGKIPALTETGLEAVRDTTWFTQKLLKSIKDDPTASRIAYALVWRNSNGTVDRKDHYYAPYPGHPAAADFILFKNDPLILFADGLPNLYQ